MWVVFTLLEMQWIWEEGSSLSYPGAQLHTITPYLQYFVSGVAADDNLVFEGVLGLGRLNFPIDRWLHKWAWVSFE